MKFVLFTLEFPPQKGGVSKYYHNLVRYWPGGDIVVLANGDNKNKDEENIFRRKLLFRMIFPRWIPSIFHLFLLVRRLSSGGEKVHVVVGQILPLGLVTNLLSKILNFEYSVVLHGLDFSLSLKRKKAVQKILTASKRVICANSYTSSQVKSVFHEITDKVFVANPGIEPNFIRNPKRVEALKEEYRLDGKKVLFFMGRLVERKGVDKVISSMKDILSFNPQVHLVIGGSGPDEDRLKKIISESGDVSDNVTMLGYIDDGEYWAWLELCDIFIMTSRDISGDYEGFGIVYLEANLAGKPVVAGDSGGVRDAVMNNVNGLLVDPEKEKEIASAVINLLKDDKLCQELGSAGNRRVVETMSAKKQAEKIYEKIIG